MAKVITIKQPYAQLICIGAKKIESRPWNTNFRGELLIHTSKKLDFYELDLCYRKPFKNHIPDVSVMKQGMIIGKVNVVDCIPYEKLWLTVDERDFGFYKPGVFGWVLEKPVLFDEPIEAQGKLGLWNWPPEAVTL